MAGVRMSSSLESHSEEETLMELQDIPLLRGHLEAIRKQTRRHRAIAIFTPGDAIEYIGMGRMHYGLLILLGITALIQGMDLTFFSLVPSFAGCTFHLNSWTQSTMSIIYFIGVASGSFFFGFIGDRLGRKTAFLTSTMCLTYISFLVMFNFSQTLLLVFRFFSGVGIGGLYLRNTWMFEYLPTRQRFVAALAMVITWHAGTVVEVPLLHIHGLEWQFVVVMIHLPLIPVIIVLLVIPESPRFLLEIGNKVQAVDALERIARMNRITLPPGKLVTEEEKAILCGQVTPPQEKNNICELFHSSLLKTTALLSVIWFFLFFCSFGYLLSTVQLLIIRHIPANVTAAGGDPACIPLSDLDFTSLLVVALASFPGILLFFSLMEWLGRRRALAVNSLAAAGLSLLLLLPSLNRIGITTLLSLLRSFLTASVQILWVYTPEVYPTSLRGAANGYHLAVGLLGAVTAPFLAQELIRYSPHAAEVTYAVFCVSAAIACYFLPTETRGRDLED